MNETALLDRPGTLASTKPALDLPEHIVEVISDSGEGAQRCFGVPSRAEPGDESLHLWGDRSRC